MGPSTASPICTEDRTNEASPSPGLRTLPTMQVTLEQVQDIINRDNDGNQNVHIGSFSEITNAGYRCAFEISRVP